MLGHREYRLDRLAIATALAALTALAACDDSRRGPAEVMVLAFDASAQRYLPKKVRLETPTDLATMTGPAAKMLAQAAFVVADDRLHVENAGTTVHVDFLEQDDGTLVPADFHSLNLTTTYYNFERAAGLFARLGPGDPALSTPKVFYFADFSVDGRQVTDNAAFVPALPGFLVLPFDALQQIPLSINTGVVGHEYSHAIFSQRVCGGDPDCRGSDAWAASKTAPTPGYNLLRALDEGIADLFGTAITCADDFTGCNTQFIGASLGVYALKERRIDVPQCLTVKLQSCLLDSNFQVFSKGTPAASTDCGRGGNEYSVGSVFASAVWAAATYSALTSAYGSDGALRRVLTAVYRTETGGASIAALIDRAHADQSLFRLQTVDGAQGVLEAVVANADDPLVKEALCAGFQDRFGLTRADLPTCPFTLKPLATRCLRALSPE